MHGSTEIWSIGSVEGRAGPDVIVLESQPGCRWWVSPEGLARG